MSTTTLGTLTTVAADNTHKHDVLQVIVNALKSPAKRGTMRAWMESVAGRTVTTVQVNGMGVWAPTGRTVVAGKTYATLGGSRRDYAGLTVLHADDSTLIVDGEHETIAYTLD